jgi:hypothetical protein
VDPASLTTTRPFLVKRAVFDPVSLRVCRLLPNRWIDELDRLKLLELTA